MKVKYKNLIISLFFSFLAIIGFTKLYEMYTQMWLRNNFLNFVLFIIYIYIYTYLVEKKKIKINSIVSVLSIVVATILIIGGQLEYTNDIIWSITTLVKIIGVACFVYPAAYICQDKLEKLKVNNKFELTKKHKIIALVTILLANILVFLATYPGVYGYDATFQILEFFDKNVSLTSHFSISHSFFIAYCVKFGKNVLGSYQTGLAIYTLIQLIILSLVTTKVCLYATKISKNNIVYLLSLLLFSIFPLFMVMNVSSSQDTLFGALFALVIINMHKINTDRKYEHSILIFVILGIELLLLCMARNNGLHAILVSIPFILLFGKRKWTTLLTIILVLISYKIYTGPIYDHLKVITESPIREISSIPSQQLARVYTYNKKAFNKNEMKKLNTYYYQPKTKFQYYDYNQSISDSTKAALNIEETKKDLDGYVELWIDMGLKDSHNYIEAFLLNNLGLWYPNKNYNDHRMYHPYVEYAMTDAKKWDKRYIDIKRNSLFPVYDRLLNLVLVKNAWKYIPVISTLFTQGFYFIIFIYLIIASIYKKKKENFAILSMVIGLYATLFLSPVTIFRYFFPILIVVPIMISMLLTTINKNYSKS